MEFSHIIGRNVRSFRKLRGMTQQQLSKKSGLNRAYIGYVERGEKNLSIDTIVAIAKALEIKPHFLWMEDVDEAFNKFIYR